MSASNEPVSGKYACLKKMARTYNASGSVSAETEEMIGGDEILSWQYDHSAEDRSYASCATDGKRKRVEGSVDLTGSFVLVRRVDKPFRNKIAVGDSMTLYLFHRKPTTGLEGSYDQVPAKILGISGGPSVDEGGEQRYTVSFGLNEGWNAHPDAPSGTSGYDGDQLLFDQTADAL